MSSPGFLVFVLVVVPFGIALWAGAIFLAVEVFKSIKRKHH